MSAGRDSLFRHGDPLDAADAFLRHALEGDEWEGRDNYPAEDRKTWIERGVGEGCERFIEQSLDDYESARVEVLLSAARLYHRALEALSAEFQLRGDLGASHEDVQMYRRIAEEALRGTH